MYTLVIKIVKEVHAILPTYMAKLAESRAPFKEHVIDKVVHKEEVEWKWIMISQSIDSDNDAIQLLREIVTLW